MRRFRLFFLLALGAAQAAFGQAKPTSGSGSGSGLPAGGANGKWLGFSGGNAGWLNPIWIPISTGTTNGDILYFNGTSWVRRGAGSNGDVLTLSGGVPTWAASGAGIPLSTVTTNGDMLVGTGNAAVTRLAPGSNGQVLTISGGIPAWADPISSNHITLQSSMPGAPDVGGLNLTLGGVFGDSVSVDGNIDATGLVSGLQVATSGVRLLDRRIESNLGATTAAYGLHHIGTARVQAIATPSAPSIQPVGGKGAVVSGISMTFSNAGTITRASGNFVNDGYVVGSAVTVTGSASNNSTFRITAVSTTALTVTPAPANETVTATLTGDFGNTSYTYYVSCRDEWSNKTLVSPATTITNGNFTLNSSNYNTISWPIPDGAYSCDVLKTNTSTLLANVAWPLNSYNDQGASTSAITATVANTTGDMQVDGQLTANGANSVNVANDRSGVQVPNMTGATLYSQASTGTDTTAALAATTWVAVKFTMSGTEMGAVGVRLKRAVGMTSGSAAMYLYSDSAGVPGSDISLVGLPETNTGEPTIFYAGSGALADQIGTTYTEIIFRLPQLGLTNGTAYWAVIKLTEAGGAFSLDSAAAGSNLYATASDSGGAPGAWTGSAVSPWVKVYGSTGRGVYAYSPNHYALYGKADSGFGVRGIAAGGPGGKFDSTSNFGVGGTSVMSIGVRGSSNTSIAVQGVSDGTSGSAAGGQFQCRQSGSCIGIQAVSTGGPALQAVPTSGLALQVLNGAASYAQTATIGNDGYITSITPFTLTTAWLNAAAATTTTLAGHKLPARAFTVTDVNTYVSSASGGGAANTVIRISDGSNNCDATFACNTVTNTTGAKRVSTTGTCTFAASATLSINVTTAGCTATQPTLKNIDVVGKWQ